MSILKIVKYGDPVLRVETKDVHKVTVKIQKFIKDLINTMYVGNGIGLAAPQVAENYKIFVIDISQSNEANPIVFINPKIIKKSGAIISNEGCLSFPEVYIDVRRYSDIMIKAKDRHGKDFVIEAKDGSILSRAIQHEMDHLNGILFIDHAIDIADSNCKLNKKGLLNIDETYLIKEDELEKATS